MVRSGPRDKSEYGLLPPARKRTKAIPVRPSVQKRGTTSPFESVPCPNENGPLPRPERGPSPYVPRWITSPESRGDHTLRTTSYGPK